MATTADLKTGLCLDINNDIFFVLEFHHSHVGRGGANVRVKMRSLLTGKVIEQTYAAGTKLEVVPTEKRPQQFTYKAEDGYHFMDNNTFEEVILQEENVPSAELLKEGQEVNVLFDSRNDRVIFCELPPHVILRVTYTEPGVKGDTVSNVFKPAIVETGATVRVPLFVEQGTLIKVDTRTKEYVERVKE